MKVKVIASFQREEFQRAIDALAQLFESGLSKEAGWNIRRDAELMFEALEWDQKNQTVFGKEHAERIFWRAHSIRGYQDTYLEGVSRPDLTRACSELAEAIRPLAGISHEKAP